LQLVITQGKEKQQTTQHKQREGGSGNTHQITQ